MLKTIEKNGACIIVFENPTPLEMDLINQCKKMEASYAEANYKQMSFLNNLEAQAKGVLAPKHASAPAFGMKKDDNEMEER